MERKAIEEEKRKAAEEEERRKRLERGLEVEEVEEGIVLRLISLVKYLFYIYSSSNNSL